jgi:transposase
MSSKQTPGTGRVVIGMDPHKRSETIEVMTAEERVEGGGRYGTDREGYTSMLRYARQWPERVWAIEGCAGIGKHIANRLLADAEEVVDVPPKLALGLDVHDVRGPSAAPPHPGSRMAMI